MVSSARHSGCFLLSVVADASGYQVSSGQTLGVPQRPSGVRVVAWEVQSFGSTSLLFSAMNVLVPENILGQDSGASRAAKDTLRYLCFWLLFCCVGLVVSFSLFVTVFVVYPARFILRQFATVRRRGTHAMVCRR